MALAVGAVLIIGLYNIYKPQTKSLVHQVFSKIHMENLGQHQYHTAGLTYIDDGNGNIEFTKGKLTNATTQNWYMRWQQGHPDRFNSITNGKGSISDLQHARSIKFDDGVDTSGVTNFNGMLASEPYLKSVYFGDNFDTSNADDGHGNIYQDHFGVREMFDGDPNLESIHFGKKFKVDNLTQDIGTWDMFSGDNKLTHLENAPQKIMNEYNARH